VQSGVATGMDGGGGERHWAEHGEDGSLVTRVWHVAHWGYQHLEIAEVPNNAGENQSTVRDNIIIASNYNAGRKISPLCGTAL